MKESNENGGELPANALDRKVSLTGYTNVVLDHSKPDRLDEDRDKLRDGKLPINKVGFFSYVFLTWFSPLIWRMYRNRHEPVAEKDIWQCSSADGVMKNAERMERLWTEEVERSGEKKASVGEIHSDENAGNSCAAEHQCTFHFPVITYLESVSTDLTYGIGLTVAMFGCEIIRALSFSNVFVFGAQTGARFRSGYMGIMYKKLLKLRTVKGKTSSEIINVFSVDSYRVYIASSVCVFLLSVPIYALIGTVYCYYLIGYWCFVSIGTFAVCYLGQMVLTRLMETLRRSSSQFTDTRVRRMGEILNSIKFIKMYAWEKPFNDAIQEVRSCEQTYVLYSALVSAITGSIIPVTPTIASVVTITVYTAVGNDLSASTAFAVIGTMNFLRIIVALLPFSLRAYGEAKVSFNRLEKLLLMDEYSTPSSDTYDKTNSLEMKAASFMLQTKGHLAVDGNVAYVAQQAWIFNASLKENILFGREFDEQKYRKAIQCCGLEPDLELLKDGDETEIGERGANLSGGQKQRVNLARAVYSDSDIYFLDDPLSALDVRVGKLIFHECIKSQLARKTVILVTHQLQYLKDCDEVVVMEGGDIAEKGQHIELINNGGLYTDMFRIFDSTSMSPRKAIGLGDGEPAPSKKEPLKERSVKTENGTAAPPLSKSNGILKKKKGKGKLVLAEEAGIGEIGFSTYHSYIKAAGGWLTTVAVILMYFITSGSLTFTDWWLSEWIDSLGKQEANSSTLQNESIPNTTYAAPSDVNNTLTIAAEGGISYDTYFIVYISSLAMILVTLLVNGFSHAKASINAVNRLHNLCLDRVMKAPMSFFDSTPTGRILNRFSKDLDEGDVFLPQVTNSLLRILSLTLVSIALSAYITPWILIGVVPVVIVFYIMKQISTVTIRQLKRLENITRSPLISHVNTTSQGLTTIVGYEQQERFYERCSNFGDVASLTVFLFDVSMRWIGLRLDLVAGIMTVSCSLIFVLTKGLISPAAAGLVLGLCGRFLVRLMNEAEARFTSIERLQEYKTNLISEPQDEKKVVPPTWPENGGLTFQGVVMRYRPEMDPVLRKVSFNIHPREKIGVVGRTGAGKSSLAACLFRLVEISEGAITIDGEDISLLSLKTLRSKVSTITQDPVLFSGSVRYNIDPFSQFNDDIIWEALQKVHMKEKIEQFDDSLEVVVDENGENFSVGERQLLCLARAVIRKSKILLLDEATANIDTSTDAMIQQTIRNCFAKCTVITIAHRLNTVLHSDRIIVLDAGQVMEIGTPQDLLSNPHSFFNGMIAAQTVKTPSP
ncbi:MRP5-like protein [Mya arenaria]|uniref:MRP5-like protein n=1 Tax=Mya arenaria TaxID=6604 RepID=A0ABY7DTQ9_MYAAR|nr:MRP5-like protein [Mya arenaria]